MRFGSVAFFKVLIKTVLCIAFFVPLVLCVIFAVVLWNKSAQLEQMQNNTSLVEELQHENAVLSSKVELLSGKSSTVEDFYKLYADSGLSDKELMDYLAEKNGTVITDPSVQTGGQPEKTDETSENIETIETADLSDTTDAGDVPVTAPVSEYESIHTDMTVRVPATFVREEGTVYLTFDDGPSENTYSVLHYLKKYDIKATFFVVPTRTEECYAIMKQIVDNGHAIGVHSTTHEYEQIYSSVEAYLDDFYEAWMMIYEATGVKTEIFRFPGGSKNDFNGATRDAIIAEMTRRGFRFYDWNVDSNDAGGATWTDMYTSVPQDIEGNYRSIVLMHDSAPRINTVYVLEDIIKALINKGYKFDKINNNTQPVQFIGPYA
ncbi:MAG: polysaccharide deacetylase [Oscillospiraceae bacterium]|nr:polysaccharide deacetylase [Oscillospiraceae bacterium]